MLGRMRAPFRRTSLGWGAAAVLNTVSTGSLFTALVVVLIVSLSQVGGVDRSVFFYTGDCDHEAPRIATVTRLLLNLMATVLLASSNFFIQVLNAPSRAEVVAAHARGSWLDIGVNSWRNIFNMSRPKKALTLGFLVSSVPIHFFANSMIFQIDNRESYFQLTAAAESFMDGAPWYAPGASLQPGSHFNSSGQFTLGVDDYLSTNSDAMANITEVAADAGGWRNMSIESCKQEISTCRGIYSHQQYLVVMDEPNGWNNSSSEGEWSRLWPDQSTNSLWFAGECEVTATQNSTNCVNTCDKIIHSVFEQSRYCMARPMPPQCRVGHSNAMLLAISLCVLLNFICCTVTTIHARRHIQDSLVLLGDAISAFINNPDPSLSSKSLHVVEKRPVQQSLRFETGWAVSSGPQQWHSQISHRGDATSFSGYLFMWILFAAGLCPLVILGTIAKTSGE